MKNSISRRNFARLSFAGAAALIASDKSVASVFSQTSSNCIRLGGPVFGDLKDPGDWVKAVKAKGFSAAYCPVQPGTDEATIKAFAKAAKDANISISEVGAWSNPVSKNEKERKDAIQKCKDSLA
ncbi:sugar phosphate isomerase/epimerase, partial [bacterium]|nr:sugar phosphate isomerase/epimerase [bacterium]